MDANKYIQKKSGPHKEWWHEIARKEGRLCRLCHEPVSKHDWADKMMDHLCLACYMRESELPHSEHWRLGR